MNVLCICCTILSSPLIFKTFIREASLFKNHLVGFWCLNIYLGAKLIKGGKAALTSFTARTLRVWKICIDFCW
jgi:hypothetical protein